MDRGRGGRGGSGRGSGRGQDFRSDESSRGRGGGNSGRGRGDFQGGRGGRGGFDSRAKIPVIPNDRKLQLVTNMYPVKLSVKLQEVFKRYDVGFFTLTGAVRSIPSKRLRRMVVGELSKLIKAPFAYDGMSTLFSQGELPPIPDIKPGAEFYNESKSDQRQDATKATLTIVSSSSKSSEGKGEIQDVEEEIVRLKLETATPLPRKGEAIAKFDPNSLHYVITLPDEKRKEGKPNSGKIVVQLKLTDATWNDETIAQLLGIATQYSCYRQREDSIIRENTVFYASQAKPLSNAKLESDLLLFTGIFQSYRRTNFGVVFNVDVSFFIALGAYNMVDWFSIKARGMGYRSLGEAFNSNAFKEKINKELRGMEVRVTYGVRRKYKLEGIDMKNTAKSAFFTVPEFDNAKASLVEYMKKRYNVNIKNDTLPLLLVKPKAKKLPNETVTPTWLVAELCAFTEGQKRRTILSAEERALMIERTRTEPVERFQLIDGLVKDVVTNEYFKQFPVTVDHLHPYTVTANVINPMLLEFNNRSTLKPDDKGSWNFKGCNFKFPAKGVIPWAVIFHPFADPRMNEFIDLFVATARNTGMNLSNTPLEICTQGERTEHYEKAALSIGNEKNNIPRFILCLLADANAERHDVIKRICDLKLLIPSKCMKFDDKNSFKAGVLANVLASINVKLGGFNWNVLSKITPPKYPQSVLCIMGLDVCHGNTSENGSSNSGSSNSSSVALCASLNETFTKYHTSIGYQDARREVVLDIYKMVIEVLTAFAKRNNGLLPTDILFYRDGVGEGMYSDVQTFEIAQTKRAFGEICRAAGRPNPRLTYLIVQKRNHFRSRVVQNNEVFNPPHGTAVNTGITDKDTNNFYLYSHHALQGTAKPTHYQVIEDGCGYADKLEEVTYALSHLHQGCPKTISIPVPVFYADGAAGRVADYYEGTSKVPVPIQDGFTV